MSQQEQEPHLISSYNKGTIGLYLREGEWVGVRKVSGGCLEGVCKLSGRCLEGVWKVSGRYLEGVWKVSGRCLEGVWKVSGRCLEGVCHEYGCNKIAN